MSIKVTAALTSLTATISTDRISLSARPEWSYVSYTDLKVGLSANRAFQGYNFNTITDLLISAGDFPFSESMTLTTFNFTSELCSLSTVSEPFSGYNSIYPEVTGYVLSTFTVTNDNAMTVTFPSPSAAGNIDLIAISNAGYGLFSQDVSALSTIQITN